MNGLVKIPMQFFILLIGTLVFSFYQFYQPPVFFNKVEVNRIDSGPYKDEYKQLESDYKAVHEKKQQGLNDFVSALHSDDKLAIDKAGISLRETEKEALVIKKQVTGLMTKNNPLADVNDTNYVFLHFVMDHFPIGLVGLLIAIIFLASMGSTASGLNSLASTTVVDFYKRLFRKNESDSNYLASSRWATVLWGIFCIVVALYAGKLGNLIEAVNILGSLFYGTILGIFVVAFYLKTVQGTAVFIAALLTEAFIFFAWMIDLTAFLWLNVIGCLLVMIFSLLLQRILPKTA